MQYYRHPPMSSPVTSWLHTLNWEREWLLTSAISIYEILACSNKMIRWGHPEVSPSQLKGTNFESLCPPQRRYLTPGKILPIMSTCESGYTNFEKSLRIVHINIMLTLIPFTLPNISIFNLFWAVNIQWRHHCVGTVSDWVHYIGTLMHHRCTQEYTSGAP